MNKKNSVIVFCSDKFFVEIFKHLGAQNITVSLLVTESPKPKGRGLIMSNNPAHDFASQNNIETFSPQKLDNDFILKLSAKINKLRDNCNVIGLVFAYGKIIPQQIIDLFDDKIINIHPSLLPKYRGPSPIQQAILNGDKVTGYSIIKISKKMDAGGIIDQKQVNIEHDDNYSTLRKKLLDMALENLPNVIEKFVAGDLAPIEQSEQDATYCKIIKKNDAQIIATDDCLAAYKKISAYCIWPKAYFVVSDKRFIVHDATMKNNELIIKKIQPENKKVLDAKQFANGYKNLLTYFPKYVKFTQ